MSREVMALAFLSAVCFLFSVLMFISAIGAWQRRDEHGNVKVSRKFRYGPAREVEVPAHSEFACPSVLLIAAVVAGYYAWKWHREDHYGDWNL